jgi:hypothetical protein
MNNLELAVSQGFEDTQSQPAVGDGVLGEMMYLMSSEADHSTSSKPGFFIGKKDKMQQVPKQKDKCSSLISCTSKLLSLVHCSTTVSFLVLFSEHAQT